jgi:hypothetical protein
VADLGINAGLIHYGVQVGHVDVGGMTPGEAERVIGEVGDEMLATPIAFAAEGLGPYTWSPAELGWEPRKFDLVQRAMNVGRRPNLFRSLGDRVTSWFAGVEISWGQPRQRRVGKVVAQVAEEGELLGLVVDRARLRVLIEEAIWDWPRQPVYEIPLKS